MFLGAIGAKKIRNALGRILAKVKNQNFNSLEVTGIVAKHFLGVPYVVVSARSRWARNKHRAQHLSPSRDAQPVLSRHASPPL
jgi:hypothetical protein